VSSGSNKPGKGPGNDPEAKISPDAESGTRPLDDEEDIDSVWDSLLPPPPGAASEEEDEPRAPMPTLTNEVELEAARLRSVVTSSAPAPGVVKPGSAPNRMSLLSLANDNAPTVPPPRHDPTAPEAVVQDKPGGKPAAPAGDASVSPVVEMRERFSLGDYTGALQVAEAILEDTPGEEQALRCAEDCRAVLVKMYTARIGSLEKVPIVMIARNQLRWLTIDHRAGFVLSHVDGNSTLEQILDVSGMPPLDALRILYELVQQRIISFK
jgi:hypothetical protein